MRTRALSPRLAFPWHRKCVATLKGLAGGSGRDVTGLTDPDRRNPLVPIKSWNCPACDRNFIVDSEAERDTCPWCKATVEEKTGSLRLVTEASNTKEGTAEPAAANPGGSGNAGTSPNSGGLNSAGAANSGSDGPQPWWPFEYSS